jgi:hypothetical protein
LIVVMSSVMVMPSADVENVTVANSLLFRFAVI